MKAIEKLPEGYKEYYSINLQKDKKTAILVNALALGIAVIMAIVMSFNVSIFTIFDIENGFKDYIIRLVVFVLSIIAYLILHEAVHGIAMKICGTKKVKYGFTGLYAFAGSDDYYTKGAYIFIALAPIVLWGIVLTIINIFVPQSWFWVVYFIQIMNISGAAGDLFVTIKFSRFPNDILVKDLGVGMTVFSKE
ncbi:MAG: DUF3267 domain-containing protein [Clostridia bacterium]|nr:DUF3267 domain-containing protein [Clostridia bacterium]